MRLMHSLVTNDQSGMVKQIIVDYLICKLRVGLIIYACKLDLLCILIDTLL